MRLFPDSLSAEKSHIDLIKKFNHWFIKLRFYAIILMVVYTLYLGLLRGSLFAAAPVTIFFISLSILIYNLFFFKRINDPGKEKPDPVSIALLQIILDLVALSIIIYLSGGIESALILFVVFHMIIGSILLQKKVMYITGGILFLMFSMFSLLEYYGISAHFGATFSLHNDGYKNILFITEKLALIAVFIFVPVYITSRISGELYTRETKLSLALSNLEESEKNKQRFITAIVHELKSPISGASVQLDLVLNGYSGKVDNEAGERLAKVKNKLEESVKNINEVLKVARFKLSGKFEPEDIAPVKILNSILTENSSKIEQKQISVKVTGGNETINLQADRTLFRLAFSNIIGNAVKYTGKEGGIEINIIDGSENVTFEISDTGIGIPKKDIPAVLNGNYRAENARKSGIEGTGTGLSIIRNIIEAHKGTFNILSPGILSEKKDSPGTTFIVIIPKFYN